MSLETKPSRFAVLQDDVPDAAGKKSKPNVTGEKKKKTGDAKNKNGQSLAKGSSTNTNKKQKQTLKSLAFGGTTGGKKKAVIPNVIVPAAIHIGSGDDKIKLDNDPVKTSVPQNSDPNLNRPPGGKTLAQWEEWQRRDLELVNGTYESDLEAALVQSKLDYQNEVVRRQVAGAKTKPKKKPQPVSLNEFNAKLTELPHSVFPSPSSTINGLPTSHSNENPYTDISDDELVERFRIEARLELEREKQLAIERDIIKKRQTEGVYKHPNSRNRLSETKVDEKDQMICTLSTENEQLRSELESYKIKLKKVYDIFQEAQELKDKARLLYEVENLTKLNQDLNEDIRSLHSQLEQERSKSHAAVNECRKLMEQSRRRTNTETSA